MVSELAYVDTGNRFGNMNTAKVFYPEDYTKEDIKREFMKHRELAAKEYGFDPRYMFVANQKDKNGSYKLLDEEYIYSYSDGWDADIDEDILLITSKTPNVVIGHPVADCPVIVMSDLDKNVSAIGHCSAELIDKKMPMMIADALLDSFNSKDEDIRVYVGSSIGTSWTYDNYPNFATDYELWKDAITFEDDGLYHIDIKKAIMKELKRRNVYHPENFYYSEADTATNPDYYSNFGGSPRGLNDPSKKGRNFEGMFYTGKEYDFPKQKVKKR